MNESRLSSTLNDVFIQPDLRRKRLNVEVLAPSEAAIHVQVEGTPYSVAAPNGPIQLDFPEFTPWTPESPVLYQLRVTITAGAPAPRTLLVPFGMRELTVKDDAFHLNHRPFQLRGILYRPQLPEAEAAGQHLQEAISVAKGAGFNQLVVPAHALNGDLLALAAEHGILITASIEWNSAANSIESISPIVRALRPYTALVMWQLHCAADCAPPAGEVLASLDPARVWLSFGGDTSRQGGAVLRPYHTDVQPCDAYAAPQRMPVSALGEYFYRQNGANRGLLYLEGLCCPSLPDAQVADASFRQGFLDHQLYRVFAGAEGFAANTRELQSDALRFQFDALRANVRLSGYCL
ncbi:MAG: hypothetical protein HYV26_06980, partial [Candidatus Hydrogenedentes bacterium]|nr:hypothetical protein [Candidatus Hydrogenedentota bacterium]